MSGYFEVKKAANGQFMFNLKAANNKVVLTSETYSSRAAAETGIASVKKNATSDKNFERKTASNGSPFFVLKSQDNGKVIGKSELYSSSSAAAKGIAAVVSAAKGARTVEV
ncbi:YegP family protein [Hyphomicrobium sp.]|uniref:YegP family protein n=1 Tax=Hyphomicrobium sp. TaxID=82 RepID=UPI0025BDCDF0|nr:YegP family protein [Hyphomicrobium sp.]MCC7253663.1 YegP family protein [Hyphomicrobium sp.]